ncbi:unnamed protein product, partial [Staurois parvus]
MKKVPGASHGGPLLTPGPQAVPEFPMVSPPLVMSWDTAMTIHWQDIL